MAATETLKKSRTIQFNFSMDEQALMRALGKPSKKDQPEEDDDGQEKEGSAVRLLKRSRSEEVPIVKLSQIPMAG